jgi:hypothetical protein
VGSIPITRSTFGVAPVMAIIKRRLGRPATRAVASIEKRGFRSKLATFGGGHIHVPGSECARSGGVVERRVAAHHRLLTALLVRIALDGV